MGGTMLSYPAKIRRDGETVMVSFPDLPGVYSTGDDREDAARHAVDALESGLYFLIRDGEALPVPSAAGRGLVLIDVTPSFAAQLSLLQENAVDPLCVCLRGSLTRRRLGATSEGSWLRNFIMNIGECTIRSPGKKSRRDQCIYVWRRSI
jgi:predicted RNase H-like HicB family nuclease